MGLNRIIERNIVYMLRRILKKYNDIPLAAKAALWFIFCSTLQKCISLITTPIFTRLMTTEQYGQFSIYNSWLQIFTIITTFRLNYAVFNKGMSKFSKARDDYVSTMQTLTFILTTIVFVIYLLFHKKIDELIELPTFIMLLIFAELFVTPAIDFWTIRKRYEYIYKPVVFRTLLMAFLNAGLGVIAVLVSNEKGYARIITCALVNIVFGVGLFIYNRRRATVWFNKEQAKFALLFNLPLLLHYFSQYILDQFDRIMIQKMVGIAATGIYSVAYNAGMVLKIVTQSINNALVPWQYEQLEKKEFKKLDEVLFVVYLIVAACALLFTSFAPEIIRILADEKYYEAVYTIPPVTLGMLFLFMYTTFANVEFFYDQNKFTMYISLIGAGLNICLNYIGISIFGYIAAAYTTLFCYILFAVGHYIYMTKGMKKIFKIETVFNTGRLVVFSIVVTFLGLFIMAFYDHMIIRYFAIVSICFIAIFNRNKILDTLKNIKTSQK